MAEPSEVIHVRNVGHEISEEMTTVDQNTQSRGDESGYGDGGGMYARQENPNGLRISSLDEEEDEQVQKWGIEDDLSDEDSDEEQQVYMSLGFVDKPKRQWSLLRQYFPSKAGGTPAWLDPVNLPSGKSSLCGFCSEPLQFVLQIYAPLSEKSTFHRTLFVFMCSSMSCLLRDQHEQWKRHPDKASRSLKVFRCQLPRDNAFYSSEAPTENGNEQPKIVGATLCDWCGTWKGDKLCSNCKKAHYCSGVHQAAHWRSSHKVCCRQLETSVKAAACNSGWPEYEITNEDECELGDDMHSDNGSATAIISRNRVDESLSKLLDDIVGDQDKRSWASFQEKVSIAPDQVLRYSNDAEAKPLWPTSSGQPSKLDIPKCGLCGSTRSFEFQVLPQLLYFFHVKDTEDSLDWANIVVYTCEASCGGGAAYKEEFPWVQLASQSTS